MKRIFVLMFTAFILSSCGQVEIHENVDEELASDALQLAEVVTENIDKGNLYEDADGTDKNVVDSYYDKYIGEFSTNKGLYDGVNEDITIIANAIAVRYKQGVTLETEKEDLKEDSERLKEFISTGEGYDID